MTVYFNAFESEVIMATFASYVERQQDLFMRIARTVENVKKLGKENVTRHAIDVRVISMDAHWEKFQQNHDKLVTARNDETKSHRYFDDDLYSDCEDAYLNSKAALLTWRDELAGQSKAAEETGNALDTSSGSRCGISRSLPKIALPKFSGKYVDWLPFQGSLLVDDRLKSGSLCGGEITLFEGACNRRSGSFDFKFGSYHSKLYTSLGCPCRML